MVTTALGIDVSKDRLDAETELRRLREAQQAVNLSV